MFAITGLYAALLIVLMMVLGGMVSAGRAKNAIALGDGGLPGMTERIRRHANLAENLPMAIILMGICEAQGAGSTWLHGMGLVLLVSRLLHPFGIKHDDPKNLLRAAAATGTAVTLLMGIGYILWKAFSASAGAA